MFYFRNFWKGALPEPFTICSLRESSRCKTPQDMEPRQVERSKQKGSVQRGGNKAKFNFVHDQLCPSQQYCFSWVSQTSAGLSFSSTSLSFSRWPKEATDNFLERPLVVSYMEQTIPISFQYSLHRLEHNYQLSFGLRVGTSTLWAGSSKVLAFHYPMTVVLKAQSPQLVATASHTTLEM